MNTGINFTLQKSSLFRKCSFFVLCIAPLSLQALVPRNPNEPLSPEEQRWVSHLNRELQDRIRQEEQIQRDSEVIRQRASIARRLEREQRREERQRAELARIAAIGNLAARIAEEERAIVHDYLRNLPDAQTDPATIDVTIGILPDNTRHTLLLEAVGRVHRQEGLRAIDNRRRARNNEQAAQNPGAPKRGRR